MVESFGNLCEAACAAIDAKEGKSPKPRNAVSTASQAPSRSLFSSFQEW